VHHATHPNDTQNNDIQHNDTSYNDNGTARFKICKQCLNTNIYSYLETAGGQSSNLYLTVVPFLHQY
jgi:hypothetical protein